MARLMVGAVFGLVVGVVGGAALGIHADPASADVGAAAEQAGVEPQDLLAAMLTTGERDPFKYLRDDGAIPPLAIAKTLAPAAPPPRPVASSPLVECIIRHESGGNPGAVNPNGHYGLGQFAPSTWASTPQGRAGYSVFNADANRAAVAWMLSVGRGGEFSTLGACR